LRNHADNGVTLSREPFGTTPDGSAVERVTLRAGAGIQLSAISYGAAVQELWAPDRDGLLANIVLGFAELDGYTSQPNHYFGAIIGRFANRIGGGCFSLDGVAHELERNDGGNSLHGGSRGFDKRVWRIVAASGGRDTGRLVFRHTSPDGEMGFPGALEVEAAYSLSASSLRLDLSATTDKPTIVNLTAHPLWNLAGEGEGTTDDHLVTLRARRYTPIDGALVPTGEIAPVSGTPFDFTSATALGARIEDDFDQLRLARGYDHNFVIDREDGRSLGAAASVEEQRCGRRLEIQTTEPGLQLYSGNFLDGSLVGTSGRSYPQRAGLALEPQHFPDSPHHDNFPTTVLRPGLTFRSTTIYRFSVKR
jgi:aldose 1-epimerase